MWHNFWRQPRQDFTVVPVAVLQIYNWLGEYRGNLPLSALTWTHFQPVILRSAPASTFTQMHAGKEVHCWVKLCYCWLDEDKKQLIKIIEEQYNSLLRRLPGKTLLSCQFMDQDTQTGAAVTERVPFYYKWLKSLTGATSGSVKRPPVQICSHKNPHRRNSQIKWNWFLYQKCLGTTYEHSPAGIQLYIRDKKQNFNVIVYTVVN